MSEVRKYVKKPVVIEAIDYTGHNGDMINKWSEGAVVESPVLENDEPYLQIKTLEGVMVANVGAYIIKGVDGEFYPCKPDIFKKTYRLKEYGDEPHNEEELIKELEGETVHMLRNKIKQQEHEIEQLKTDVQTLNTLLDERESILGNLNHLCWRQRALIKHLRDTL